MPRQRKPCSACGGPKEPGNAKRVCDTCRARREQEREQRRLCEGCGSKPKLPGFGYRYCEDCHVPRGALKPCRMCGENTKPRVRGAHFCDDCSAISHEAALARARAAEKAKTKPCQGCGKLKEPGVGKWFCKACREQRSVRLCTGCGENPARGPHMKYCQACHDMAKRAERRRNREWARKKRQTKPEAQREASRRWREKVKADKEAHGRKAENERLRNRMQAERLGRSMRMFKDVLRGPEITYREGLPPKPLLDFIMSRFRGWGGEDLEVFLSSIGTHGRALSRWRAGEGVRFDSVDRILMGLGAHWWEVYDEAMYPEEHELARRVFEPEKQAA